MKRGVTAPETRWIDSAYYPGAVPDWFSSPGFVPAHRVNLSCRSGGSYGLNVPVGMQLIRPRAVPLSSRLSLVHFVEDPYELWLELPASLPR